VEHPEARKRLWVRYIGGRSRRPVKYAGQYHTPSRLRGETPTFVMNTTKLVLTTFQAENRWYHESTQWKRNFASRW
jgi:hypothetical protein